MSDVFISYAHSTEPQALAAAEALRAGGYTVWIDHELLAHRGFTRVIEQELTAAKAALVLWSAEAADSEWVLSEANRAREDRKLVQARLDPVRLPMPFDQIQCADLIGWGGEGGHPGWAKTLASLAVVAGAPKAAEAPEPAAAPGNLPRRQDSLIGRQADLAQIGALLENADLVTVTGAGGVGKTRIALEFAHERAAAHEDGAWLVELAPLTEPGQVGPAIGRMLGFELPPGPGGVDALIARLRPRDCLIVLDNCEHLVDAVATVAEAILEQTSRVKLLASSQEPLGVEGERVFRLKSLGESEAAVLFEERARAADAAWAPHPADAAAIAAICQRLDGIPLAVEMAAARAPVLGCQGVLTRLDDRFRILTGGRRTALPRQRTLQATLDWSCGLLEPHEAAVFRRLGVFTAGFTLEAAARVGAGPDLDEVAAIDAVAALVAKSLVSTDAGAGQTRYRLLETTRLYALEQLASAGETAAARRAHAHWFADFAAGITPGYAHLTDEAFFQKFAPDLPNIEAAMDWAFEPDGDVELGLALTARSWPAWAAQGAFVRYLFWADRALRRVGPDTPADVALALRSARLMDRSNLYLDLPATRAEGLALLPQARAAGDPIMLLQTLNALGLAAANLGLSEEACTYADEVMALTAARPNRLTIGARFAYAQAAPDFETASGRLIEAARLARSLGAEGWAAYLMGSVRAGPTTAIDSAISEMRAMLAEVRPHHMFAAIAVQGATNSLVLNLAQRGAASDLDEAWRLVLGLEKFTGPTLEYNTIASRVALVAQDGRPDDAGRLYGIMLAENRRRGIDHPGVNAMLDTCREYLRRYLPQERLEAAVAEGGRLSLDEGWARDGRPARRALSAVPEIS